MNELLKKDKIRIIAILGGTKPYKLGRIHIY